MDRIGVLMTCHNRRQSTVACLHALRSAADRANASVSVHLVDDGSTDGTSAAIESEFQDVELIRGDGSLYWNRGMRVAFDAASDRGYDAYLWLNDDTILNTDSVTVLLTTLRQLEEAGKTLPIVVGSTVDPETNEHTYGGVIHRSRWHPLRLGLVEPENRPIPCDTFFGNCVLIPSKVARLVGNLDPIFTHALGDIDYGFRARKLGCTIWTAPGYVGTCSRNAVQGTWEDRSLAARARWQRAHSPKGLPPREWRVVLQRQSRFLWPIYLSFPYLKIVLQSIARRRGPS